MKKIFILGLFILHFSLTIQSQSSYQIDSTSKWIQEEIWASSSEWDVWNYSLSFKVLEGA